MFPVVEMFYPRKMKRLLRLFPAVHALIAILLVCAALLLVAIAARVVIASLVNALNTGVGAALARIFHQPYEPAAPRLCTA
ncbi:hypothetical protein [Herbaspirillum sp. ST 5-3]|uniref:hypothetical protein n=1 Tax=Oxalobacteraceae TaxID=75682 RepID=UPI0010A3840A|nr:hypothetical protein [Herbaspirillum sp. ST 5-3]